MFYMVRLLAAISLCFCMFSCGDEAYDYDVIFKLEYEGEPLVMLDEYEYPDGRKIKFTRFSVYISDITITDGIDIQKVKDIDFLNLTDSHSSIESSRTGYRLNLENIDINDPTQLEFGLGLNPMQNASIPADYSGDHPLAKPGEYWIGWGSYIFFKIEGIMDSTGDGDTDTNIALHIGSDDMLRSTSVSLSDDDGEKEITIDLLDIFRDDGNIYDITSDPQIHSLNQISQASFLIDNLQKQIK